MNKWTNGFRWCSAVVVWCRPYGSCCVQCAVCTNQRIRMEHARSLQSILINFNQIISYCSAPHITYYSILIFCYAFFAIYSRWYYNKRFYFQFFTVRNLESSHCHNWQYIVIGIVIVGGLSTIYYNYLVPAKVPSQANSNSAH